MKQSVRKSLAAAVETEKVERAIGDAQPAGSQLQEQAVIGAPSLRVLPPLPLRTRRSRGEPTQADAAVKKVLVIDAHPMVEEWITTLIEGDADVEVAIAGHAGSLSELAALVARSQPALVLMEIASDVEEALEAIRGMKAACPKLRLLVFSSCDEGSHAVQVLRAGAHGFVSKSAKGAELLRAIRLVLEGGLYLSTAMIGHLAAGGAQESLRKTGPAALLSERELQVFAFIGDGLKPSEIAQRISLSVKTVESYVVRIRQKLKFKDSRAVFQGAVKWSKTRD